MKLLSNQHPYLANYLSHKLYRHVGALDSQLLLEGDEDGDLDFTGTPLQRANHVLADLNDMQDDLSEALNDESPVWPGSIFDGRGT